MVQKLRVACATGGLVLFRATYHLRCRLASRPYRERGVVASFASRAHGRQLRDALCLFSGGEANGAALGEEIERENGAHHGNEIEDVAERLSLVRAVERRDDDDLPGVRELVAKCVDALELGVVVVVAKCV
jgi:hypothetical protein